jgi:protein-S-isoprenylcysteine O-methyltransferase Ste14
VTDEQTFRAVGLAVMLVAAPIGAYHRLRARRVGAEIRHETEPTWMRLTLKLAALPAFVLLVLWLARPGAVAWAQVILPAWLRWTGAAIMAAAVPLLGWTFHTLGHNLTDTVETRANSYLVVSGPYRFVRHPFYTTVALFSVGFVLLSGLWPVAILMAVVLTLLAVRTPLEERKLVERFGDEYVSYAARTWRYVPRPWLSGRREAGPEPTPRR